MTDNPPATTVLQGDRHADALVVEVAWEPGDTAVMLCAFVCSERGMVVSRQHFVFHRNSITPDRAAFLLLRSRGGANVGGQLALDLTAFPEAAVRIDLVVAAPLLNETLEPVSQLRVDVWDPVNGAALASSAPGRPGLCSCLVVGRLVRAEDGWGFEAATEQYPLDFASLARDYGVKVNSPS